MLINTSAYKQTGQVKQTELIDTDKTMVVTRGKMGG